MLRKGAPTEPPSRFQRLVLERLDPLLFRCSVENLWKPPRARGLFGGQIIGLCLEAAQQSADDPKKVLHSMHCYFVKAGRNDVPLIIHVSPLRQGKSFCTHTARATQGGETIFALSCSFHRKEAEGATVEFHSAMPRVSLPEKIEEVDAALNPLFDTRVLVAPGAAAPDGGEPSCRVWMRCRQPLMDDPSHHASVLAYASDTFLARRPPLASPVPRMAAHGRAHA